MPYNSAMTKASPSLERIGFRTARRAPFSRSSRAYFNPGVSAFERARTESFKRKPFRGTNYYNANVTAAFGLSGYEVNRVGQMYGAERRPLMGDLFNDIMSSVVGPAWDNRSPELKNIKLKVDPAKVLAQAKRLLPPDKAAQAAEIANQYGVTGTYRGFDLSPERIRLAYEHGGIAAAAAEVPVWMWIAGAGGLGLAWFMLKR